MRTFKKKLKATQQTTSAKSLKLNRSFVDKSRDLHSTFHLHRPIGNQAVSGSLQPATGNIDVNSASSTSTFEPRMQFDFSKVKVHADNQSDEARSYETERIVSSVAPALGLQGSMIPVYIDEKARSLTRSRNADGLMTSGNIYLNPDTYRPEMALSKATLAHELTHLAQYRRGGIKNRSAFVQNLSAEFEAREAGKAVRAGFIPKVPRESLASSTSVMAAHSRLEQASLELFIPRRLPEIGERAGMSSEEELVQAHDHLFNIMVPTNPWRGYDRENVRRASLGGAIFELLARTPWEDRGDVAQEAWGGAEASMGLFQAYPQFVARSLTNPALRQWMWEHGDPRARQFVEDLPGRELPREQQPTVTPYVAPQPQAGPNLAPMSESFLRGHLRGTDSPIMESFYLSLTGKIQHTLFAIMELDRANPVMRSLSQPQQLRIWMDYETDDVVNSYYSTGEFQSEHEREPTGAPINIHNRETAPNGSAQRHVMAHLGFTVWAGSTIPNPP